MSEWSSGFAVPKPIKRVRVPKRLATSNPYKDRSIAQEDRVAAEMTEATGIPFQRVKLSGGVKEKPGDVRSFRNVRLPSHKWLMELKLIEKMTTGKKAEKVMTILWDWLHQIMVEAQQENSLPALLYGYPGETQEYVVLRKEDFQRLLMEHKQLSDFVDA